MLQNKIYLNFFKEILKTFFLILFGLSVIAWTVRAVNFLDLIVESGYPLSTYFKYSALNLLGILTKFIPLSFLLALIIFIVKQMQENEFIILWTTGVKKIQIVNLFLKLSLIIIFIYLFFSIYLTPFALNKSRQLLGQDKLNSFIPTIRVKQFSDSFKGFTFLVDERKKNQIKNIFLFDKSNNFKNLSRKESLNSFTTIVAADGIVEAKTMVLFNGQIISTDQSNNKNDLIKFDQLNIDLGKLETSTIKVPKLQETSTLKLISCFSKKTFLELCNENVKKEIIPILNRRIALPLYIPVVTLLSCILLIRSKQIFYNKFFVFLYSFIVLLYVELIIRYTGLNSTFGKFFILFPALSFPLIYFFLLYKFKNETKSK